MLRRMIGGLALALALGVSADAQQPMALVATEVDAGVRWQEGRVWDGPRATGEAGALDRIGFEAATGDLVVVITGHPTRSGEEGAYAVPGDCVMRLARPDLAGATLTVDTPDRGVSRVVFTSSRGVVAGALRVSAGCDTTGGY